ncbi:RICIN domain-containing protein [Kitasatospora sp. GP82]|uniref:RICIN domain-containing protein n=1 Tax=Kitasatospora sp. GP82 TaxID=3035089 RepID=UPI00247707BF|nr:RICIN domain-containing protein [Kitasatospora sp. GP82]MDH6130220.1 hypothetical protein [Kitasatospora sp. GP82]
MRSSSKAWRVLTVLSMAAAAMVPLTAAQASPAVDRRQAGGFGVRTFAGKCLDVKDRSPADRTPIIQYTCDGGSNQRFTFKPASDGWYEIRTFAGKCLDVKDHSPADGTPIIQYTCDGAFNQQFRLEEASDGRYEIETFAGKCLDVKDHSPADRTPIIQYTCDDGSNQRFLIVTR